MNLPQILGWFLPFIWQEKLNCVVHSTLNSTTGLLMSCENGQVRKSMYFHTPPASKCTLWGHYSSYIRNQDPIVSVRTISIE